jgi:hypothetical protein
MSSFAPQNERMSSRLSNGVRDARTFSLRTIRAVKLLARDGRIPRPFRWVAGLALLPIPGPVDEGVLLLVGFALWAFYREPLAEAWQRAEEPVFTR